MPRNRYNGPSGAYGTGSFFDDMESNQYKDSFHNPIVQAQGSANTGLSPTPMNPQVNTQVGMNSNDQYLKNTIGDQSKKYGVPTDMNDAIRLRNESLQDGVDGAWGFYQEGINKQGSGGDIYSKFDASNWDFSGKAGIDMTNNFGSNLEVGKTLSANPAESTLELSNSSELPNFANQGYGLKNPGQYQKIGSDPTMDYEKALDLAAVENKRGRQAAAVDDIWNPGLPNTEGMGNNLPMTTVANPKDTWEKNLTPAQLQKINASKELTPWEIQQKRSKLRASQKKMLKGIEPGPLRKPTRPDTS